MQSLSKVALLGAGAFFLFGAQAGAQNIGTGWGYVKTKPILAWAAKTATPAPYVEPNRPIWRISEIMAAHNGQTDWVQPTVRNRDFDCDYISMGAGKKTKAVFYADDPVIIIVQSGQIRFNVETQQPFVASKGFRVTIPYRLAYSMETVGNEPSVRWEVRPAGEAPNYPITETPTPIKGVKYIKATYVGHGSFPNDKPPYMDFFKIISQGGMPGQRGPGVPTPPASNFGHFHSNWGEFWFIAEGTLDFQIEGEPLIHAHQGDVVSAAYERWHRPTNAGKGMSTRIAFIPRTNNLHWYQPNANSGGD
jgi:quercetin dioxygenase-like cupin family protein